MVSAGLGTDFSLSVDPADVADSFGSESEVFEIFGMSVIVVGVDEEPSGNRRLCLLQLGGNRPSFGTLKSSSVLFVACDKRAAVPLLRPRALAVCRTFVFWRETVRGKFEF